MIMVGITGLVRSAVRVWRGIGNRVWGVGLIVALMTLRIWDPGPLTSLRLNSFDFYQQIHRPTARPPAVLIIDIDEKSLKKIGQWPWPRTVLADLMTILSKAGVVAVGFDMVFAEEDRTSPDILARRSTLPKDIRTRLRSLNNHDQLFATALKRLRVVLGRAVLAGTPEGPPSSASSSRLAFLGSSPKPYLISGSRVLTNLPILEKAATSTGSISYFPEVDSIVRRVPLLMLAGDTILPALSLEMLRVATGGGTVVVKTTADGVQSLVLRNIEIPTDSNARFWVRFRSHDPQRYVSASDVLDPSFDAAKLNGRLVLIGTSATGLLDLRSTPIERALPGVEIHAQILENIMFKEFLTRPRYANALEFFTTLLLCLLLVVLLPKLGAVKLLLAGYVAMILIGLGTWYAFSSHGLLLDLTFPIFAIFSVYVCFTVLNYLREERSRREIRTAFSQYVSPDLVAQLARRPDQLRLGGDMRELTVLFADIRGFTTISEGFSAGELTEFINQLFTPLGDVVMKHNGTIDKFIGDSVMAFWNAPIDDPKHAEHCARAALAMLAAVDQFNVERSEASANQSKDVAPAVRIGIGFNSGVCCVGNLGSTRRFDYSAIGDAVNIASRLEGQTKQYGFDIIFGESARQQLPEMAFVEIGDVEVRGRAGRVRTYGLLGDENVANSTEFAEFKSAYADLQLARANADDERISALALQMKQLKSLRVSRVGIGA